MKKIFMYICKYVYFLSHFLKKITFTHDNSTQDQKMYFKSQEDIEKAIDEVGEENFIKYFLGVEL